MRTIAVVTSSRADYSHLYWVLHELRTHAEIRLHLIAFGAHLSPQFGSTAQQIEIDGFAIDDRVESLLSSDTDVGMAKTIGMATLGLADVLARVRPDLLLIIADRYEMLAPASVALALRIPIAHIEGGEVSEGAIDQAVRNALSMMSHVHLAPTANARRRLLAMGEEPWRVHQVGAPSLDHLVRSTVPDAERVEAELEFPLQPAPLVVAYHPLTLAADTTIEADAVFAALAATRHPIVFCFPNADAGSHDLVARAQRLCAQRRDTALYVNLEATLYWGLLGNAAALVGNSSSGIMEAASLGLPAVNIGARQQGRERAQNVIDVDPEAQAIGTAIERATSTAFRASLEGVTNPYGDGDAARRIVEVLSQVPIDERLLRKPGLALDDAIAAAAPVADADLPNEA